MSISQFSSLEFIDSFIETASFEPTFTILSFNMLLKDNFLKFTNTPTLGYQAYNWREQTNACLPPLKPVLTIGANKQTHVFSPCKLLLKIAENSQTDATPPPLLTQYCNPIVTVVLNLIWSQSIIDNQK